jgi:2'-5' RNA ligase
MIHHWDFFGPDAEKTAEHFKVHFSEFSKSFAITTDDLGFFSAAESHVCFWISVASDEHSELIQKKLRPRRSLSPADHTDLLRQLGV